VVVPLTGGRTVPIIADEYVDPEFGTGALKITPGHDVNDYELGKKHGLPIINIMADDGSLTAAAGPRYAGVDRFAARALVWADLGAAGLALREEPHASRVPRSQRGGEIVEPLVREQWFVRMDGLAPPALAALESGALRVVPERFAKTYRGWLEGIRDWCVSRQLWWGHRIPVYYLFESEAAAAAYDAGGAPPAAHVAARSPAEARARADAPGGPLPPGAPLRQERDVLDTWFSSALWPFSTLGWPTGAGAGDGPLDPSSDLARFYPTNVMETGHDILFFWVARMVMMGIELTGKVPFDTVYLHGLVRDEAGRKMSKSLGNVVDPVTTVDEYGADALRWTLATGGTPGQDLNLSLDRVLSSRNFSNKIWNAAKFVLMALENAPEGAGAAWAAAAAADFSAPGAAVGLPLAERWAVSAAHAAAAEATAAHEALDVGEAGRALYEFAWSDFADWYIESAKARLYGDDPAAAAATRAVLAYVLDVVLRLAHPFMPFITEELWQALPRRAGDDALAVAAWPADALPRDAEAEAHFAALRAAVRAVRNARAEYGVEPGRRVAALVVVADDALRAALEAEAAALALLARLDPEQLTFAAAAPAAGAAGAGATIELVVREGLEVRLPMAGLFDAAKEVERLRKQAAKAEKDLSGLMGRLGNATFAAKAPPEVVAEAEGAAAELREQLAALAAKIAKFEALG
jgi:valyl-tRNA synthetase